MKVVRITAVEPNYPVTFITIGGHCVDKFCGIPEPINVHDAINYRHKNRRNGALLPFSREYADYITPERLLFHLPYFRNVNRLH